MIVSTFTAIILLSLSLLVSLVTNFILRNRLNELARLVKTKFLDEQYHTLVLMNDISEKVVKLEKEVNNLKDLEGEEK